MTDRDLIREMAEALDVARTEMIDSGNWGARDYGWPKACMKVGAALTAARERLAREDSDGAIYAATSERASPEWHQGFKAGLVTGYAAQPAAVSAQGVENMHRSVQAEAIVEANGWTWDADNLEWLAPDDYSAAAQPAPEPALNLNDRSVQKRLAAQWGFVAPEPAEPVAPWPDFLGQPIRHGATLTHPDGTEFVAVRLPGFADAGDAWRAVYSGHEPHVLPSVSRLCLQIGDKGRAVLAAEPLQPVRAAP